jgi:hypothetical protein
VRAGAKKTVSRKPRVKTAGPAGKRGAKVKQATPPQRFKKTAAAGKSARPKKTRAVGKKGVNAAAR